MERSESVTKLITALSKAQGEFSAVSKTGRNPHLKNTYATLDSIISAIRGPLSKNGIVFTQPLSSNGEGFVLETALMHESGEWLSCSAPIPHLAENRGVNELQAFGGALTYMRRYMLSALLGINTEEDTDGNGGKPKAKRKPPAQKPAKKTSVKTATESKPDSPSDSTRPYAPDAVKQRMTSIAERGNKALCTQAQRQLIASKLNECFAGSDNADSERHTVTEWLFGITTTKLLTRGHVDALLKWVLADGKRDDTGDYPLHPQATAEAAAIIKRAVIDAGQTEMDLDAETE